MSGLVTGNLAFPFLADWLLVLGMVGFFAMGLDKGRAMRGEWRIPEMTLFIVALFGGSLGMVAGSHVFRHKTSKMSFLLVLYSILVVWLYALQKLGFISWLLAAVLSR